MNDPVTSPECYRPIKTINLRLSLPISELLVMVRHSQLFLARVLQMAFLCTY